MATPAASFKTFSVKQEIIKIMDRHLGDHYLLIAFGSFASGRIDRLSDIDLALYSEPSISTVKLLDIKEDLATKIHTLRTIDLINLGKSYINPHLLHNILAEGALWKTPKNSNVLLKNLKKRLKNTRKR